MNEKESEENKIKISPMPPIEVDRCKIGSTTYIVTVSYDQEAKEGLLDKLWWLIRNDTN
ncbi:MAG: transposon-encoded TnpW family protein [Clostridiales bacterium]|jgi:hypothetical protein|nr:transposon-encoded TnpW family protein [Clostridiales bacterium]